MLWLIVFLSNVSVIFLISCVYGKPNIRQPIFYGIFISAAYCACYLAAGALTSVVKYRHLLALFILNGTFALLSYSRIEPGSSLVVNGIVLHKDGWYGSAWLVSLASHIVLLTVLNGLGAMIHMRLVRKY